MTDEISKKMAMVAGDETPQLTREEKEKLSKAYLNLFVGLAAGAWARNKNKTLGAAWYEATGQIKQMLGARNKNNAATSYLQQVFSAHSIQMARQMMISPNKDAKADIPESKRAEWNTRANKRIGDAMQIINQITTKHQDKTKKAEAAQPAQQTNPNKFAAAQKLMLIKIIANAQQHAA